MKTASHNWRRGPEHQWTCCLVVFSPGLFLLPIIPLVRLAYPGYRTRPLQAEVEVRLGLAVAGVAFAIPTTPEGSWSSSWIHAGGAASAEFMIAFWPRGLPRRSKRLQLNDGAIV